MTCPEQAFLAAWDPDTLLLTAYSLFGTYAISASGLAHLFMPSAAVQGSPPDLQQFTDFFKGFSKCHKVIIDCTADAKVPSFYSTWLSSGIHVVTPNKKLCSGPLHEWTKVRDAAKEHGTHFMYEV